MIGYGFWKEVYGGDPAVIGRTITVDDQEYQLVGVTPRDVVVPFKADVWLPFSLTANSMAAHKLRPIPITRLIPPITLVQAQQRMDVLTKRLAAERPRRRSWDAHLQSVNGYRSMGDTAARSNDSSWMRGVCTGDRVREYGELATLTSGGARARGRGAGCAGREPASVNSTVAYGKYFAWVRRRLVWCGSGDGGCCG